MNPSDSHRGISSIGVVGIVQVLEAELDADPRDDDESAVDERRIALHEHQQLARRPAASRRYPGCRR